MHKDSEDDLAAGWINRIANGDPETLAALYRLYHRPLLSIYLGILGSREAAEEVLQDTFVRAFHKASAFDASRGTAFAWLVTIGRRLAIDRIRRERARPENKSLEQTVADHVQSDEQSGADIQQKIEYDWLAESMQLLTSSQRTIIEMAFFKGYTHIEIAEKLDLPIGTVKSHIYRGLDALRKAHLGNNDGY